jgi:hypothetical protein
MIDAAEKRGQIIRHLEDALALADEIEDGTRGFLMERALDEARSHSSGWLTVYDSASAVSVAPLRPSRKLQSSLFP